MHGRTWCLGALPGTTILFICFSSLSSITALHRSCVAQDPAKQDPTSPNELVRRVVENELKAEQEDHTEQEDHSHWSFRETIQKPPKRFRQGILGSIDAHQCSIASISGALRASPWREPDWCVSKIPSRDSIVQLSERIHGRRGN
jgi:hypothetical protein